MKRVKKILSWVLVITYFPVVLSFVGIGNDRVVCRELETNIEDSLNVKFLTSEEVELALMMKYPSMFGNPLEELNCDDIETFLKKHPAVKACDAFYSVGGALKVNIKQRVPLVRVFDNEKSFYFDEDWKFMPVFENHSAHTLVVSGHLKKEQKYDQILSFAEFINASAFWKAQIEQIYIEVNGDVTLVPRVGDHVVNLGDFDNYEKKMGYLYTLYTEGLAPQKWNDYKEINLKYNGQIVCTKRD